MPDVNSPLSLPSNISVEDNNEASNLHLPQNISPPDANADAPGQGGHINLPAHMPAEPVQAPPAPKTAETLKKHNVLDGFTASTVSANLHQHGNYGLALVGGGIFGLTIFVVAIIMVCKGFSSRRHTRRETKKINERNDFIIQNQGSMT